ncbi:MAG: G8 domain-containing protein, partial [Dermatophilaceae bacterium]
MPPADALQAKAPSTSSVARWSDSSTWVGGRTPGPGDDVTIPDGRSIVLDVATPPLGSLWIAGELVAADRDVALTASRVELTGLLQIGTADRPHRHRATITLTGRAAGEADRESRAVVATGKGRLELHGIPPKVPWTQLSDHAAKGARDLRLLDTAGWRAGDSLVVAPTDHYGDSETEQVTVSAVTATAATIEEPLDAARWGKLQHVTRTGMSLTPDREFRPPAEPFPTVLDERAEVGNLTRNVVIQGPDDDAWTQDGFGATVMVVGSDASARLDGVELTRVGKAGVKGGYPFHLHHGGYDENGAPVDDLPSGPVTDQEPGAEVGPTGEEVDANASSIRNSTVSGSTNRCVVLHGVNGVQVEDNICHDIAGHAFFLEDAVERRNVFARNLAVKVRNPAKDRLLQKHEAGTFEGGSSGFWLTNPDNDVVDNHAADTEGNGLWNALPRTPLGDHAEVEIQPDRMRHGAFTGNVAHSSGKPGILLDWAPTNAAGDVAPNKYIPTSDEGADRFDRNRVRFALERNTVWKSQGGAYRNRVSEVDYPEWVTADSCGTYYSGAGDDGRITRHLVVGTSLNDASGCPDENEPPVAFASYHSTFSMTDNVVVGFPFVDGRSSGAFKTTDYYLTPVDKGLVRNPGNLLIDSSAGYRFPPPAMRKDAGPRDNWTLAGALLDAHGYWGPRGNYWVYDTPFLTAGASCRPVAPAGKNGMSCAGEYFGVSGFTVDTASRGERFVRPVEVTRQDAAGRTIGDWTVADGKVSTMLGNMRHFTARPGGEYVLRFPGTPLPSKRFEATITNAYRPGDSFVMAVSWAGPARPTVYTAAADWNRSGATGPKAGSPERRDLRPASSLAQVRAGKGDLYYVDQKQQLLWFSYRGGLVQPGERPV